MRILNVTDVAHYFLAKQDETETAERITNLKMQKLCYYAQGFALVKLRRPLFSEDIEHWQHGPVVPALWREYRRFRNTPIPPPKRALDPGIFNSEVSGILDDVIEIYGSLSAWELRNMTYAEPPWNDTPDSCPITHQKLRAYFETVIKEMTPSGQPGTEDSESNSLASKMASDAKFRELTEQGLSDLAAGRYFSLEEVRRTLVDL